MSAGDSYVLVYSSSGSYRIIGSGAGSVAAGATAVDSGSMPSMNAHSTIEWDRTADNVFWIAASGNQLKQCSINGINSVSCVSNHTFAEYAGYRISFMDETSMNPNGWLTMVGQNTQGGTIDVFQWNPGTLTKSSTYTTTCTADINAPNNGCLHKLIATPNNGVVIQFAGNGTGAEQGNRLWETPYTTPLPHIENSTDHEDCMRDLNNNQVCAFEDFLDNPGPWLGCSNGYRPTIVQVQGTSLGAVLSNFLCAFDMPSEPGWDVSTEDWPTRPWVVYSYQGSSAASPAESCNNSGSYADPTSSNWHLFESEVMLVRVDAQNDLSKIYRLANTHERGKCGSGFWDDPRAGTSFDGKYVIFDSNSPWAATGCGSDSAECTDVFMIGPLF